MTLEKKQRCNGEGTRNLRQKLRSLRRQSARGRFGALPTELVCTVRIGLRGEERLKVGEGKFRGGGVAGFEDAREEGAFFVLQREHFFFDGAARD